jgi:hypothetical protein
MFGGVVVEVEGLDLAGRQEPELLKVAQDGSVSVAQVTVYRHQRSGRYAR